MRLMEAALAIIAMLLPLCAYAEPTLPPEAPVVTEEESPPVPDWLPKYDLEVDMPSTCGMIHARQRIEWTNTAPCPANEILLHCYPRHRPTPEQRKVYERTIETFRLNPRIAIDYEGRRFHLRDLRMGDTPLEFYWDDESDTLMHVQLPKPIQPGERVELSLEWDLDIQEVHYRLGRWKGVTSLTNWYPIVAYHGKDGWNAPPFVGWHQPWLNEAGNYNVTLRVPPGEQIASSGQVVEHAMDAEGRQEFKLAGSGIRDFSVVISKRHEVLEGESCGVKISVHAFPEHRLYAQQALQTAVECIERYSRLIGPYPHKEFKIVETYFGWNGNETSAMILIDQRVFEAPQVGHLYVDHLVGHEILHQWWYATVGTDGYHETWMDEAIVSHLTELRIHEKYGENVELLDVPKCFRWLPNVNYDVFMHNGYYMYKARGGNGQVLAPLKEIGHVHNLFFLAYDRGSRIVGMIHRRMGTERFYAFLQMVYAKYRFRVLFVDDFQRELEEFTGESWQQFFDDWLRSPKSSDWKVGDVAVEQEGGGYKTTVSVRQLAGINEPVDVGIRTEDGDQCDQEIELRPDLGTYETSTGQVTQVATDEWKVTFHTAKRPRQVVVDPESEVLDDNPRNNHWRIDPKIRFAPFYTPLEEVAMVRPLDRPSFSFGPGIDWLGRLTFRGSLMQPNYYRISPFIAYPYTEDDGTLSAGVDGEIMNRPVSNLSLGFSYNRTLATDLYDLPLNQGDIFLRKTFLYTSSFFYPNLAYADVYYRFGDNFWPDADYRNQQEPGVIVYRDIQAFGTRFHLDTRMPYWAPDRGFTIDGLVEGGTNNFGGYSTFIRGMGQVAGVHKLPDGLGYLSETRLAARVRGGIGNPDNGKHFHFGGPTGFRGQRSEDTEGSAFWLASCDYRVPFWEEANHHRSVCDNVVRLKSLYGSVLYDVGDMYLKGDSEGLDHAIGGGLYFDFMLLSFLDRITLRTEYAKSMRYGTQMVWFGMYYAY